MYEGLGKSGFWLFEPKSKFPFLPENLHETGFKKY
jgi:hypothetical protein